MHILQEKPLFVAKDGPVVFLAARQADDWFPIHVDQLPSLIGSLARAMELATGEALPTPTVRTDE